jgi:hypothetical protein
MNLSIRYWRGLASVVVITMLTGSVSAAGAARSLPSYHHQGHLGVRRFGDRYRLGRA